MNFIFKRLLTITVIIEISVHEETKRYHREAAGESLIEHAKGAEFSAQRGIVGGLFPYIFQASKRMSARAISGFLEEKHDIKVSYVTLGKALRQPDKYWNIYFDAIEPYVWIVADAYNKPPKYFISESDKYQELVEGKPVYASVDDSPQAYMHAEDEYKRAIRILHEKWFCFDDDVLEEARCYVLPRLSEKPSSADVA
jgi:hypothetical protein